jgi:hypothetical protein
MKQWFLADIAVGVREDEGKKRLKKKKKESVTQTF